MSVASPPTGVNHAALIRCAFEILTTRDVQPPRALWTEATVARFPSVTPHGADAMAGHFQASLRCAGSSTA